MNTFEECEENITVIIDPVCYYKIKVQDLQTWNNHFLKDISEYILTKEDIQKVVVDMEEVNYLDSSTLGIFIQTTKTAIDKDKKIVFVNMNKGIWMIINATGLEDFFTIMKEPFEFPCESIENNKRVK